MACWGVEPVVAAVLSCERAIGTRDPGACKTSDSSEKSPMIRKVIILLEQYGRRQNAVWFSHSLLTVARELTCSLSNSGVAKLQTIPL